MGKRLTGFDYSRPYFYMVTIKRCKGIAALSEIVAPGRCQMNAITRSFVNCIRHFHEGCKAFAAMRRVTTLKGTGSRGYSSTSS